MNHKSFDEPKQPAGGMDTGQWHRYYEAFWSNLFQRLDEKLENDRRSRPSVVNKDSRHDHSLN